MSTLHLLRSEPDDRVREIISAITPDEVRQIALCEDTVDYDRLVDAIFNHDRIISWW